MFTDDDLKRLKEICKTKEFDPEIAENIAIWVLNSQPALLARLEAAEYIISRHFELMEISHSKELAVWRKAAGKGV